MLPVPRVQVSRLNQWDEWLDQLEEKGIVVNLENITV